MQEGNDLLSNTSIVLVIRVQMYANTLSRLIRVCAII